MKQQKQQPALVCRTRIKVRFSEVDSMRIVWHGGYVRYFEDGREAFGERFGGLGYAEIAASGYTAPIVKLGLEYKSPLTFGETAVVETRYYPCEAAKIIFGYTVYREKDMKPAAEGESMQVFLNSGGELELTNPEFYQNWKKRWGIL